MPHKSAPPPRPRSAPEGRARGDCRAFLRVGRQGSSRAPPRGPNLIARSRVANGPDGRQAGIPKVALLLYRDFPVGVCAHDFDTCLALRTIQMIQLVPAPRFPGESRDPLLPWAPAFAG